jgi:hypothetical protein
MPKRFGEYVLTDSNEGERGRGRVRGERTRGRRGSGGRGHINHVRPIELATTGKTITLTFFSLNIIHCFLGIVLFGLPSPLDVLDAGEARVSTVESELSSRGSIPVVVEENSLLPTPDDGPRSTTFNDEDESESDSLRCAIEAEDVEEEEEEILNQTRHSDEWRCSEEDEDDQEQEEEEEEQVERCRRRRKSSKSSSISSDSSRRSSNRQSAERQALSRDESGQEESDKSDDDKTKSDLSLGNESLEAVIVTPKRRRGGKQTSKKRRQARPKRWKLAYKAGNR